MFRFVTCLLLSAASVCHAAVPQRRVEVDEVLGGGIVVLLVCTAVYFLPWIIAAARGSKFKRMIFWFSILPVLSVFLAIFSPILAALVAGMLLWIYSLLWIVLLIMAIASETEAEKNLKMQAYRAMAGQQFPTRQDEVRANMPWAPRPQTPVDPAIANPIRVPQGRRR